MSLVGTLHVLVVAGIAAGGPLIPPSELVLDALPGYDLTSGPATDLDFAAFALIEPDSVAHIEPDSEEAAGLVAAMETWGSGVGDDTIVVEVVRAIDDESAATLVDQAAANSIAIGLAAVDPPFPGAWTYSGGLDGSWTNVIAWTQGPYAVLMRQLSSGEIDRASLDRAAARQAEIILDATGGEVSLEAAVGVDAPSSTEAPPVEETEAGFPFGMLMVVVVAVAVPAGVMLRQRRRYPGR